ncbi:MAG: heavy-metal-associated domain-containing protein [Pseudomonadota bacterium]
MLITVDNIKCGGCANSIRGGIAKIPGVISVEVDVEGEAVLIAADRDVRAVAIAALRDMGYPEKGSLAGLGALGAKAKSFVSCAVGRLDKGD